MSQEAIEDIRLKKSFIVKNEHTMIWHL